MNKIVRCQDSLFDDVLCMQTNFMDKLGCFKKIFKDVGYIQKFFVLRDHSYFTKIFSSSHFELFILFSNSRWIFLHYSFKNFDGISYFSIPLNYYFFFVNSWMIMLRAASKYSFEFIILMNQKLWRNLIN